VDFKPLYPLTYGQRWLHHVTLSSPDLNKPVQRVYQLPAPLNTAGLLRALRRVVAANESLRLRLVKGPEGWQQCFTEWEPDISGLVVRGGTAEQRLAYTLQCFNQQAAQPFDLTTDPPLAALLVRIDDEFLLGLSVDHLAADDLGFDQLEAQLARAYRMETNGSMLGYDSVAQQGHFREYIARESTNGHSVAEAFAYWRQTLQGAPLAASVDSLKWVPCSSARLVFAEQELDALIRRCRARACSPFAAVLTAQALLLSQIGGSEDLVVNVPISNRVTPDDHLLVANLSILTHLRIGMDAREPVSEMLHRIRDTVLKAVAHRRYDYPSLSAAVADEARARGGRVHWVVGCSYVVDRGDCESSAAGTLKRVDQELLAHPDVPHESFALSCRQYPSALEISAEWDPGTWPISGKCLQTRLAQLLEAVTRADLPLGSLLSSQRL
jgi:hypothetical protein